MCDNSNSEIKSNVQNVYGDIAKNRTGACSCNPVIANITDKNLPDYTQVLGYSEENLKEVPETANLGLGCGNPTAIANLKEGEYVVDLGSGGGFDCFLASRKVGSNGRVVGVDMTEDMIKLARENAEKKGYKNVDFRLGDIENMPIEDGVADVIISNCVVNLSSDKAKVFRETARVLKSGGRLAISDIVATAELPDSIKNNMDCFTGCMSGAVHVDKLRVIIESAGFRDVQIKPKEESRSYIADWAPGTGVENFVVSADISAIKI